MAEEALIRREALRRVMQDRELTYKDLEAQVGGRYTYWRDLVVDDSKSFGEKIARKIESKLQPPLPRGYLDLPQSRNRTGGLNSGHSSPRGPAVEKALIAHELSDPYVTMTPTVIAWGELMGKTLPAEFETRLPDNAMAPIAPKDSRVIFVSGASAEPGDWVLVRDKQGNCYCRELRLVRHGRWEAHAMNDAYLPLDSERDGLEILAVFDGIRGRRAPR